MATHSSFCLENPRDGGAWWAAIWGRAESDMTEATAATAAENRFSRNKISTHEKKLEDH